MEWFNQFEWNTLIAFSIIVTVVVEALKRATPEWVKGKLLLPIVSTIITLLFIQFDFSSVVASQATLLLIVFMNSFAILFYEFGGKKVLDWIFTTILGKYFPKDKDGGNAGQV